MGIERRPAPGPQSSGRSKPSPPGRFIHSSPPSPAPAPAPAPASPPKPSAARRVEPVPAKPGTGRVPKRTTSRMGRAEGGGTSRAIPTQKKSNTPVLIGAGVGGLVLLIVIVAAATSGSKRGPSASNLKGPAALDVSELESRGLAKCEEGCAIIQRAYDANDKAALQRGIALITEGNGLLDQAHQRSGNRYDTKRFNETLKMARGKVLELK